MNVEREIDFAKLSSLLQSSLARIVCNATVCEVTMDSVQKTRRAVERSHASLQKSYDLLGRVVAINLF